MVPELLPRKGLEFLEANAACGRAQCALCPQAVSLNKSLGSSSGAQLLLTSMCLAGAKSLPQAQIPQCRRNLCACSKAWPGNEQSHQTSLLKLSLNVIFLKGGAATAALPPAKFVFLLARLGAGSCQAKGLSKQGTTKQADTSNELQ